MSVKVADAFVAVNADLRGYQDSLKQAEKDAQSLGQRIKGALGKSFLGQDILDFRQIAKSARTDLGGTLRGVFLDARRDAGNLGTALKGLSVDALHRGLSGVQSVLGKIGGGIKDVFGNIAKGFAIGVGIGSVYQLVNGIQRLIQTIPDLLDKGKAYGQLVDDISDSTGATAEQSSKLAGALQFLGAPLGNIMSLLGQASQHLDTIRPRLEALGIATRGAGGASLNLVEILDNLRSKLSALGTGSPEAAALLQSLARSGLKVFADYAQLSDEQWTKLVDHLQSQGLVLTESQRNLAEQANRASNDLQNSFTGLGVALFTTVGPQITSFVSGIAQTITTHMSEIRDAIGQVISYIVGLVSGLTGISADVTGFATSLGVSGSSASAATVQLGLLQGQLSDLDKSYRDGRNSSKAMTQAIDDQIAAVDRETETLKKQETAQERLFQRELSNLAAVYQKRLDALDLAEKERDLALQARDLNEQLNEAMLDLAKAQAGEQKEPGVGPFVVNAERVSAAMAKISDLQRQQAEAARQQQVDAQRAALDATKSYIDQIAKLEADTDADHRRALAANLASREKALSAQLAAAKQAGDAEAAANLQAEISAIASAEKRNKAAMDAGSVEARLAAEHDRLEKQKQAATDSTTQSYLKQRKALTDQITVLQAEVAKENEANAQREKDLNRIRLRYGEVFNGPDSLPAGFETSRLAGVKMANDIRDALVGKDGKGGVLGAVDSIVDAIKTLIGWVDQAALGLRFLTDPALQEKVKKFSGGTGIPGLSQLLDLLGGVGDVMNLPKSVWDPSKGGWQSSGARASGGPIGPGFWKVNERGEEGLFSLRSGMVLNDRLMRAIDRLSGPPPISLPALAAAGGGGLTVNLYLNGRKLGDEIVDEVERVQADRRRF